MENTNLTQTEIAFDHNSILLASLILNDVNQTIRGIQTIVAVLLRYVEAGVSITNCLLAWVAPTACE